LTATYPWITGWSDPTGTAPHYSASTNSFTIATENYATYDNENILPTVFKMRMVVQDTRSTSAAALVYDEFSVTIKYACDDDVVTLTSDKSMVVYSTSSGASMTINANFA